MKTIKVLPSSEAVNNELLSIIQTSYSNCKDPLFTVGLSGGSLINSLTITLLKLTNQVDWSRWRFFFCDERIVPFDDSESTYGAYWKAWQNVLPIKQEQFIVINPHLDGEAAAQDYVDKIKTNAIIDQSTNLPKFHLLLLGMGPDGHTASLFPNHLLLKETSKWVAFIGDSPKPPPKRVTLTYSVINNADCIVFVSTGSSKSEILKKIFVDGQEFPASKVNPTHGKLIWLLDQPAGALIPQNTIDNYNQGKN